MGAEPFLIASCINAIMAQRVVRQICPECRISVEPPEEIVLEVKEVLGSMYDAALERGAEGSTPNKDKKLILYKGKGCKNCNETGYKGRIGVYEVLLVTEKMGKLILEHQPASALDNEAKSEGMISMKQDGYLKALEGLTTLEEVLRVAQD